MKKYKHQINHNKKIIYRYFSDRVSLESIRKSWLEILNLQEFAEKNYHLIPDYRKAKLDINPRQMEEVFRFYRINKERIRDSRLAAVSDTPKPTAFSVLFERNLDALSTIVYGTFSTIDKAIQRLEQK